jgi:hypothetical protein
MQIQNVFFRNIEATTSRAFAYKICGSDWLAGFASQLYCFPRHYLPAKIVRHTGSNLSLFKPKGAVDVYVAST